MKKILEKIIKMLVYASFFVPLVVISSSFIFPFIVPKILIFRSLVLVMLGCYILLLIINWQEYKLKFTPLNLVLVFFLLSFTLSTFLGVDAYHSFWDNHERMLGLFTVGHYVIYYFICSALFKNWSEWKFALKIFLLAGSLVMIVGVMQKFDPNFLMNQGSTRVASTLGNSIYVGGYGLFLIFVAALLFLKEKDKLWRGVWVALGALSFLGLIFSGTRGSLLGLLVGLFFVLLAYSFALKEYPLVRKTTLGILFGIILILGVLFLNRQTTFVNDIPVLGRLLNVSLSTGTAGTRLIAWKIAVESWKERPIFGWGPNNFFYAFNKYYNPQSLESGYSETWFDNAHNIILNTLTVQGLFGLLCYLSIFIVAVVSVWQNKELRTKNIHLVIIGSAFLLSHLIQNITVFEDPTSYLYFMFWLAMMNHFSQYAGAVANQENPIVVKDDKKINPSLIGVVGAVVAICIFVFDIQPARANMKTLAALNDLYQDPTSGLVSAKEALNFNSPHIDDIRSDISRTIFQLVSGDTGRLESGLSTELLNLAYDSLLKDIELHPLDIRNYISLAQLGQVEYSLTKNTKYILDGEKYLDQALLLSPRRQQIHYMLSLFKLQVGKTDEAILLSQQSLDDDPKIMESYWRLAYVYQITGQNQKAKDIIALAKERGFVFEGQGKQVEDLVMSAGQSQTNKKK